jgi:hypothetical protein
MAVVMLFIIQWTLDLESLTLMNTSLYIEAEGLLRYPDHAPMEQSVLQSQSFQKRNFNHL